VLARRLRIAGKRVNDLSDDERNLLRYYAETERIIHGLVRVPFTSTCGETQARYVVGSREGLTPDLLWHDPGWARQIPPLVRASRTAVPR
jgi:hypothetical protein